VNRQKTRSLKKYEADPTLEVFSMKNPDMQILSPFGPMIAKTQVPATLLDSLNKYADTRTSSNLGCEFILPEDLVFKNTVPTLADFTTDCINRYLGCVENSEASQVEFETFWVVSQYAGTPSPVHFHSGDISGVMYLKTPVIDQTELEKTYISGRQAGYINFISGGKQRYSKSIVSFEPRVGDFYIFPGWLLHGAEPFKGDGERRSIAFNAHIRKPDN